MNKNRVVKGLILYEFYTASGSVLLMLMMSILLGLLLVISGKIESLWLFAGSCTALLSCTFMLNIARHGISRWDRFQLAVPTKRKYIIDSQYIGQLLMLAVSFMIVVIFTGLSAILHKNLLSAAGIYLAFSALSHSICMPLVMCGLYYPLAYIINGKNDKALSVICILAALVINISFTSIGYKAYFHRNTISILCIVASAMIFVVSYVITSWIYSKKDF